MVFRSINPNYIQCEQSIGVHARYPHSPIIRDAVGPVQHLVMLLSRLLQIEAWALHSCAYTQPNSSGSYCTYSSLQLDLTPPWTWKNGSWFLCCRRFLRYPCNSSSSTPRDFIGVLLVLLFDQTEHGSPLRVVLLVAVPPQGHLAVPHLLRYVSRGWFRPVFSIHHTLVALDERLVLRDRGDGRLGSVADSFLLHGQEFLLGVLESVSWRSLVVFGRGTALTRSDLRGRFGSRFVVPRVIRNVLFLPVVVLIFGDVLLAGFRNGGFFVGTRRILVERRVVVVEAGAISVPANQPKDKTWYHSNCLLKFTLFLHQIRHLQST
jgi:hypothetical protein